MPITQPHTQNNTRRNDYEALADFVVKNSDGFYGNIHKPIIKTTCRNFEQVGRLIVVSRGQEIKAVCYFDITSWDTAFVHDIVIQKESRGLRILKSIIVKAITTYPQIRKITFESRKHGRLRTYAIEDFFKGDLNGKH